MLASRRKCVVVSFTKSPATVIAGLDDVPSAEHEWPASHNQSRRKLIQTLNELLAK